MKNIIKLLLLILICFLSFLTYAQTFGVRGGLNLANMTAKDDDDTYSDEFEMNPGFHIGGTVEGAYSLNTKKKDSEASLTRTLSNAGQIMFYVKVGDKDDDVTFYIDNISQGSYANTFWGLQSFPVSAGEHIFKWKFRDNDNYSPPNNAWIDFIVMPK